MRPELIHPMLVHFPLALLSTGVVIRFASLWGAKRPGLSFLLPASWLILGLGVIAAWLTVIAGEVAAEIIAPTLQNMSVLEEHAEHALITASGFTIALLVDWIRAFLLTKRENWTIKKGLFALVWLLYLFSLTNLMITGFYGANLVYEQGAAVAKPNH